MAGSPTTRRIAVAAAGISSFLTPFMSSSINIALPAIGRELGLDAITLGWVATASLLSAGIFLLPLGRVADIYGRRLIFALGLGLYTFASIWAMLVQSGGFLIFARFLQGVGGAMIFGTGVAILSSVYPIENKGLALGINTAAVYLGLSLGPFLGGVLTHHLGWRAVFAVNLPFSIAALVLVLFGLKGEWAEARGEGFDITGSLIYAISVLVLMLGLTRLPETYALFLVLSGLFGLITFTLWEIKHPSPVFPLCLFSHNPAFTFSNLAALINYSATAAVGFLLSLYLQYIKGFSAQNAGLILVSQPLVMALFSPLTGRLSDRIEPRIIASRGMAFSALGLFLFIFFQPKTPLGLIVGALVLVGFGFALFSAPNTNAVMGAVESKHYGSASATLGTMRLFGQMLSYGIAMMLVSIFIGYVHLGPQVQAELLRTIRIAFVLFGLLCAGGVFASLARGGRHSD